MQPSVIVINNATEVYSKFPPTGVWILKDLSNAAIVTIYKNGGIHISEDYVPDEKKIPNFTKINLLNEIKNGNYPIVFIGTFPSSYNAMEWMKQHQKQSVSQIILEINGRQNHTTWQRPMPSARHMRGFNSGHGFGRIVGILGEEITSTSLAQNAADVVKATEQAVVNDVLPTVSQAVTQTSQSVQQALSPQATTEQSNRMKYIAIGAGLLLLYLVIKK
jgi:hypothetical protein